MGLEGLRISLIVGFEMSLKGFGTSLGLRMSLGRHGTSFEERIMTLIRT